MIQKLFIYLNFYHLDYPKESSILQRLDNGLEIARRVRQVKTTPIIMMTARDSVIDRVSGLDHGADDYIVKPFARNIDLVAQVTNINFYNIGFNIRFRSPNLI